MKGNSRRTECYVVSFLCRSHSSVGQSKGVTEAERTACVNVAVDCVRLLEKNERSHSLPDVKMIFKSSTADGYKILSTEHDFLERSKYNNLNQTTWPYKY